MLLLILLTEGRTRNLHTWQKYDAKHTHTEISLSQQNAHYAKSMGLRKFGEGGSLSACFSSSLHLKSLEQKKKKKPPVKLEMSGGNTEAMDFPSISGKDNSMDSLLLRVQGDPRSHG